MKPKISTQNQLVTVAKLAKWSGLTIRTLHYYDQIGLLSPSLRTDTGYRKYGPEALLRLQQILFYRELEMPLEVIREVLDDPGFSPADALAFHRQELINRKNRIDTLLKTIDNTLEHINNNNNMKPEDLYHGLAKETAEKYRKEARKMYGENQVWQAEQNLMKMGKEGFQKLQADFKACAARLFQLRNTDPTSREVQDEIRLHYGYIRQFWGTSQLDDRQGAAYAGLGQMYTEDDRFTMVDGKPEPEYATFMRNAMAYFARTELSGPASK